MNRIIGIGAIGLMIGVLCSSYAVADSKSPEKKPPPKRYVASKDTVLDTKTKLVWQRATSKKKYNWKDAATYCHNLRLGGYSSGWRLPTQDELLSIVEVHKDAQGNLVGPQIDSVAFPNTPYKQEDTYGTFWSSSRVATNSDSAWVVHFYGGYAYGYDFASALWVRCVR